MPKKSRKRIVKKSTKTKKQKPNKLFQILTLFVALGLLLIVGGVVTGFVVSDNKITFDQIAAAPTDMANALRAYNILPKEEGAPAGADVTYEDIQLHKQLNDSSAFTNGVDHSKLAGFWKGTINIDLNDVNKDYRTHEKISFEGAAIETGLSSVARESIGAGQEYKDIPFMTALKDDIKYQYVFDEDLNVNNRFANASSTRPIFITILGNRLRLEGTGGTDDSIVAVSGEYCDLLINEECTAYGHKVKFEHGSSAGAKLSIDGEESEWITDAQSYKFKNTGIDIYVEKVHDIGQTKEDFNVEAWVSDTKAKKEYKNGDEFIGEDENNPRWVWEISGVKNTARPSINVSWDQRWDQANEVVYVGDSMDLPGKASIKLEKLMKDDYRDYVIGVEVAELRNADNTDYNTAARTIYIESQDNTGDGITVNGKNTDKVYIFADSAATGSGSVIGLYYKDTGAGGKAVFTRNLSSNSTSGAFTLEFEDTSLAVDLSANWIGFADSDEGEINLTFREDSAYAGDNYELKLYTKQDADGQITYLGHSQDDTTITKDWCYEVTSQGCEVDISGYQENTMTDAGIKLLDPKASSPADEFTMQVPQDISDFDVRVAIYGPSAEEEAHGLIRLSKGSDSNDIIEVSNKTDTKVPIILVGGPCVNILTAKALKLAFPACGEDSGLKEGEAVIKLVKNAFGEQSALLVYGWEAEDTRTAVDKINKFTGTDLVFSE